MSTEYHKFMAAESARLQILHPHYTKSTIRNMARDEWRSNQGCGSTIRNRFSTLRYEINKALIERVPQHNMKQYEEIFNILKKKECMYCMKKLRKTTKKGSGDHFFAVQADSSRAILTNFSALTIPCCFECNNSRGKKPVKDFTMSDQKYQSNVRVLKQIEEIVQKNLVEYEADTDEYKDLLEYTQDALDQIRTKAQRLTIRKISH